MIKKTVTLLKITKNKRVADRDNMFTYMFEWINGDVLVWKEIRKISADELMLPLENYDVEEIILHKQECCMLIDRESLIIETVEL
jgi:hypothetical protein